MIEYLKFGIFVTLTDIPALIVSFNFSSWSRGIINAYCIALLCISLCKKIKKICSSVYGGGVIKSGHFWTTDNVQV